MSRRQAVIDILACVAALCVPLGIVFAFAPDPTNAEPATTVLAPTPAALDAPAVPTAAAVRVTTTTGPAATGPATTVTPATTTTTVPVFRCADVVNAIAYTWGDLEPARTAYRETARCLDWTAATITAWEPFIVDDVIRNESGGCWNLRRGATLTNPVGCVIARQGKYEDSGFSQLVGIWWRGPGTPVCDRLGLCTSNAIIGSPWNSMAATLVAVEWDGSRPWCWDARARRLHPACASVPRRWSA